jgi:hypothetical protein
MNTTKYVKDLHGHVYIYTPAYSTMIGSQLFYCDPPEALTPAVSEVVALRTLTEVREAAKEVGLDIPDGTPTNHAKDILVEHVKNAENTLDTSDTAVDMVNSIDQMIPKKKRASKKTD